MSRFVISDLHFGHSNIIKFEENGKPIRDFASVEEMNDCIITNWNETINDKDTVYVLGDVAMPRKGIALVSQLKGRKVLVKGNHDLFPLKDYLPYFDDIRALALIDTRAIMTHIPIHPDCLGRFKVNIHGHLHTQNIDDPRYVNVCVEKINYTPVLVDDLLLHLGKDCD